MTRFSITRRQAIFIFIICTISSKLQTLPCLLVESSGKGLWAILLFGALIDAIFLTLTILVNKLCPNLTMFDIIKKIFGKPIAIIFSIMLIVYFLLTAFLPYEAVRNVFANNLFDTLPWTFYSIFLIFAVGYLAFCGLKTIGRSAELYFVIIVSSVGLLILLGAFSTNYERILPIFDFDIAKIPAHYLNHALWFGDYMIFFALMGQIDTTRSALKFKDVLIYLSCIAIYIFAYIIFYGQYSLLGASQTSLLTSISSFSLLNLSIGRMDWFLVLFTQIASVLSLSTYIYCIANSANVIFGKKHYGICSIISVLTIYLLHVFLYGNTGASYSSFLAYTGTICLIIQVVIPLIAFFATIIFHTKKKEGIKA